MHLLPLGDQAVMACLANETAALHFAAAVRQAALPWVVDVVPAYTRVAVFFDLERMEFAGAAEALRSLGDRLPVDAPAEGRLVEIPCCYELGLDLPRVAEHTRLDVAEVIRRHAGATYTVYAIGFGPGFPYLGYLPEALCGVPRLPSPRLRVERGSVGLTGRQTGIYTEVRPGGWNIIGRTPLELVHVGDGYFPLRAGDRVRFAPIGERAFRKLEGKRLA
jgi:inhibitor of KinA